MDSRSASISPVPPTRRDIRIMESDRIRDLETWGVLDLDMALDLERDWVLDSDWALDLRCTDLIMEVGTITAGMEVSCTWRLQPCTTASKLEITIPITPIPKIIRIITATSSTMASLSASIRLVLLTHKDIRIMGLDLLGLLDLLDLLDLLSGHSQKVLSYLFSTLHIQQIRLTRSDKRTLLEVQL